MAISGYYSHGIVSLIADADASNLTVSRNAAGTILVNGGAVGISGGVPTVANTSLIQVFGLGGDEFVTLDESIGELPRANVFGGWAPTSRQAAPARACCSAEQSDRSNR